MHFNTAIIFIAIYIIKKIIKNSNPSSDYKPLTSLIHHQTLLRKEVTHVYCQAIKNGRHGSLIAFICAPSLPVPLGITLIQKQTRLLQF